MTLCGSERRPDGHRDGLGRRLGRRFVVGHQRLGDRVFVSPSPAPDDEPDVVIIYRDEDRTKDCVTAGERSSLSESIK